MRLRNTVADKLAKTALQSGALLIALAVTWQVIRPLQALVTTVDPTAMPPLVYLPFGIAVLCAYFDGFRVLLFLMPGAALSNHLVFHKPWDSPGTYADYLVVYACAPLVFLFMDWAALSDRRNTPVHRRAWRVILFGGTVAALLLAKACLVFGTCQFAQTRAMASHAVNAGSHALGLVVVMLSLMWIFRLRRQAGG